jgi:hypothetical protein
MPGYGMTEQDGLQFAGGDVPDYIGKINMSQPPSFSITLDPVKTVTDSNALLVSFTESVKSRAAYGLIVVGTDSNVSAADPTKYLYAMTYSPLFIDSGAATFSISEATLQDARFTSGTPAYVVAYPLAYGYNAEYSSYLDVATGRSVYTSLGARSNFVALIVP